MQKIKIRAFWRKFIDLRLNKFNTKTKKLFYIIPGIAVLLGVLFLFPSIAYPTQIEADTLIQMTNKERTAMGLESLRYDEVLTQAATNKARAMLEGNFFSHNSPDGRDFSIWIKEVGYEYAYTGENLAMDFMTNDGVMQGWMNSRKHKENILSKNYKEIGMAVVTGEFNDRRTTIVTQIFGTSLDEFSKKFLVSENN